MASEKILLSVGDPTNIKKWLEIHVQGERSDDYIAYIKNLPLLIKYNHCIKCCSNYKQCGGVKQITYPYNRLEKQLTNGEYDLVKPGECTLNGVSFTYSNE